MMFNLFWVYFGASDLTVGQGQALALSQQLIDRVRSSVLCVSKSDGDVIATAIVWDYTNTDVLLLTNYHTWDSSDFRYCFPPAPQTTKKSTASKGKRKRKKGEDDKPMVVTFHNNEGFYHKLIVGSSVFHSYEEDEDFAVLKIPKAGFTMPRIAISLEVSLTLKIHAFGYIGHSRQFNVTGGEISGLIPEGFTMNLLSAGGYTGATILADGYGRAVGYMGGNLDASKDKNSQHQSYAFRFDRVIHATNRQITPAGEGGKKSKAVRKYDDALSM